MTAIWDQVLLYGALTSADVISQRLQYIRQREEAGTRQEEKEGEREGGGRERGREGGGGVRGGSRGKEELATGSNQLNIITHLRLFVSQHPQSSAKIPYAVKFRRRAAKASAHAVSHCATGNTPGYEVHGGLIEALQPTCRKRSTIKNTELIVTYRSSAKPTLAAASQIIVQRCRALLGQLASP